MVNSVPLSILSIGEKLCVVWLKIFKKKIESSSTQTIFFDVTSAIQLLFWQRFHFLLLIFLCIVKLRLKKLFSKKKKYFFRCVSSDFKIMIGVLFFFIISRKCHTLYIIDKGHSFRDGSYLNFSIVSPFYFF